jgi:hypothetical protein
MKQLPVGVSKKKSSEKKRLKKRLPMIKCSCGEEILLVPNVKLMSKAIETHAAKHHQKVKEPKEAEAEAERIREHLIIQVLTKASKV